MARERNPFKRKRRANQTARYLNKRQAQEHRETYDRAGNRADLRWRDKA
jgi:hypothetical protein